MITKKNLPQQNLRQFNFNTVEAAENNSTLATSSKHWKWQPVDETFTLEEFNIKKQMFEGAKAKDKDFSCNPGRLTWENTNLTNIVADGFALMRSVMSRCWYAAPSHYLPHSQTSNQFFGHFNLENDKHDIHLHSSKILDSSLHTGSLTTKTIKTSTCSAEPQSSTLCGSGGLIRNTVDGLWGHQLRHTEAVACSLYSIATVAPPLSQWGKVVTDISLKTPERFIWSI